MADVADLIDEQRIAGKLERLSAMRLQAKGVPYPADRRVRKAGRIAWRSKRRRAATLVHGDFEAGWSLIPLAMRQQLCGAQILGVRIGA